MSDDRTILVVDEVHWFRELGESLLARSARVISCGSAEQAIAIARREHPDVVISDLELSGSDGAELCRQIRKDPVLAWTPVVIAIGSRSPKEHARAIRAGATDVLTKPLSESALFESISRLMHAGRPQGRPRIDVAAPVQIDGRSTWGTLRNLSRGGAFVETPTPIAIDREVRLDFRVPGSRRAVHPTARVVWSRRAVTLDRPVGQGLQFLDVDRASLSAIEQFVGEQMPEPAVHSGGV